MAATTWRINAIGTYAAGDLELSALHLYNDTGRIDGAATLTCSHVPVSGALASLRDDDFGTVCRFAASDVRSSGFFLEWVFPTPVDVKGLRLARGTSAGRSLAICDLQRSGVAGWEVAQLGRFPVPSTSTLTPEPQYWPVFNAPPITPFDWTPVFSAETPGTGWLAAGVSDDGSTAILGARSSGSVQIRKNGGSWTVQTGLPVGAWGCVAASRTGQVILAGQFGGALFRSGDGGNTWAAVTALGSQTWYAAHLVGDGAVGWAVAFGGNVYRSVDYGVTWSIMTGFGVGQWADIGVSADGEHVVCVDISTASGNVSVSHNGGGTVAKKTASGLSSALSCDISDNGSTIIVGGVGSTVKISRDGGDSWTATPLASGSWQFVKMDGVAKRLIAGSQDIYRKLVSSVDGGVTWSVVTQVPEADWSRAGVTRDLSWQLVCTRAGSSQYLYEKKDFVSEFLPKITSTVNLPLTAVASAPVPAHCTHKLRPADTVRDVEFGGSGRIWGTTKTELSPGNRVSAKGRVSILRERDKLLAREVWSDPVTGDWEVGGLDARQSFIALAQDPAGNYMPAAADRTRPEEAP